MSSNVCQEEEQGLRTGPEVEVDASAPADAFAPLDSIELEALALNQETSLRVYTDHHFFSWTQGLLQNLLRHEVLICTMRTGDSERPVVESYTMAAVEPEHFSQRYRQSARFGERLVRDWEKNFFQPVLCDLADDSDLKDCEVVRELQRIGARRVVAHGTHDAGGRMGSFFIFGCRPEDAGPALSHMAELLVPFVHAAWMRTKASLAAGEGANATHAAGRDLLTLREREVLKWVYLGKSNIEIGMILGISALTVKNHVQEILRRLNVQNRAQAVGKAFNLHILSN
jgi:transcriptional regulator EpsA